MAKRFLQFDELDPQRIDSFESNVVIIGFCRSIGLSNNMDLQFIKLIQWYWYGKGIVTNDQSSYVSLKFLYRYHSDGMNDFSWGCVYRNFQTLLLEMDIPVPSLRECMQYVLSPEKANLDYSDLVGSKRHLWIEPHDLAAFINTNYKDHKLDCKLMIYDTKTRQLINKEEIMRKVTKKGQTVVYDEYVSESSEIRNRIQEFIKQHQLPIIIDDGDYSYILMGISCDDDGGDVWYLIGDPHYGMMYGKRDVKVNWNDLGKNSNEENNIFNYGPDFGKIQWKPSTFLEESNKTWMMLFVTKSV